MNSIHEFTETTNDHPGYISIVENDGRIFISVRTHGVDTPSFIEMNVDQLTEMGNNVSAYLTVVTPTSAAVPTPTKPAKVADDGSA